MSAALNVYAGCDSDLLVSGVMVERTGAYLNAATVPYTIYGPPGADGSRAAVSTGTLTLVSGSTTGDYEAVIESSVTDTLTINGDYRYSIPLVSGSYNRTWAGRLRVLPPP